MKESDGGAGFAAGFVLGGIAGAALALFLTPRSGDENRDVVRERGIELKVKAEEAAARARGEADDLLTRGKVLLDEQKSRLQEAVTEGRDAANQARADLMARYKVAKETGQAPFGEEPTMPEPPPENA